MNKYKYQVILETEIEAFEDADAFEMIQDAFGIGENMGVTVTSCEYKETKGKRR